MCAPPSSIVSSAGFVSRSLTASVTFSSSSATSSATAPQSTPSPPSSLVAFGYVASYHVQQVDDLRNYPWKNYTHMSFFGT